MSGLTLKEPDQINWDGYESGSKYKAPPVALDVDGKPIKYFGLVPQLPEAAFTATDEGYRQWLIDPITITRSGAADGYQLRFTRVSTRKFMKNGQPVEASTAGNFLRSAGITAKPQKNAEYDAAVRQTQGKVVQFTVDWEAYNKDNGEKVKGYQNFPDDPERLGQKKAILKAGDKYKDADGVEQTVKSEVLFANARVKFFQDNLKK